MGSTDKEARLDEDYRPTLSAHAKTGSTAESYLSALPEPLDDPYQDVSIEDLSRLWADALLRDKLASQGFTGNDYDVFVDDLARYGYQLMWAWLGKDYIFSRCREFHIDLRPAPIPMDERDDLVQDVVANALNTFLQKGLAQGGWQPERGASMRTYFTRAICFQFANSWRRRLKAAAHSPVEYLEDSRIDIECPNPGPEEIVVTRDEIRRGLADIRHERARFAIALRADGYSYQEIAEIIGISARAVEGYFRRNDKRRGGGGSDK